MSTFACGYLNQIPAALANYMAHYAHTNIGAVGWELIAGIYFGFSRVCKVVILGIKVHASLEHTYIR